MDLNKWVEDGIREAWSDPEFQKFNNEVNAHIEKVTGEKLMPTPVEKELLEKDKASKITSD